VEKMQKNQRTRTVFTEIGEIEIPEDQMDQVQEIVRFRVSEAHERLKMAKKAEEIQEIQMKKDLADANATRERLKQDLLNTLNLENSKSLQLLAAIRAIMPNENTVQYWSAGPKMMVRKIQEIIARYEEKDAPKEVIR
jgi:hypothetical protein